MTKPFTFRSREGCLVIGRYLKSCTGVLAIHRSDSQLGIFFRSDRKVSYESHAQISLLVFVYVTKKDSWSFETNLFFTNWVPQESLAGNKRKQRD